MVFRLSAAEFANSLQTQSGRVYKWSSGSVLQSLQMVFELIVAEFVNGFQALCCRVCKWSSGSEWQSLQSLVGHGFSYVAGICF